MATERGSFLGPKVPRPVFGEPELTPEVNDEPESLSQQLVDLIDLIPSNEGVFENFDRDGEYQLALHHLDPDDESETNSILLSGYYDYEETVAQRRESSELLLASAKFRRLIDKANVTLAYKAVVGRYFDFLLIDGIHPDKELKDPYSDFIHLIDLDHDDRVGMFYETKKGRVEAQAYKLIAGRLLLNEASNLGSLISRDELQDWRRQYKGKYDKPPLDFKV